MQLPLETILRQSREDKRIYRMGVDDFLLLIVLSVLLLPPISAIGVLVSIMTCSWSQNVRKRYVDLLLKIFEVIFPILYDF